MPINDYQLFVNIPQGPKEKPHIIRTIEFVLQDVVLNSARIRALVSRLVEEKGWDPVPDRTPFYIGMVILSTKGRDEWGLGNLINSVMNGIGGVLFKDGGWCDGISVIRPPQEEGTNDARITVSWKEIITPAEVSNGRMGNN